MNKPKEIKSEFFFVAIIIILISCSKDKIQVSPRTEILNEIVSRIENHRYGEVHSLIIAEDDSIIFEKYFNNYTRENRHAMYSVTKSFTSAL